jgi:pimeloyl-ACP methyl ester carboxylesterase
MERAAIVFVHGLFSSSATWESMSKLLLEDPSITERFDLRYFDYSSKAINLRPTRRIPNIDTVAEALQTYVATELADYGQVMFVTHSQGGLIVQRYIARMLNEGRGAEIQSVKQVIMFAAPNSGSEFLLTLRKMLSIWRNPQERELRPFANSITETQRTILKRSVYAQSVSDTSVPISFVAYVAASDNIVRPDSAKFVFPNTGVLPGDHFSIIKPDSAANRTYKRLKQDLIDASVGNTRPPSLGAKPDSPSTPSSLPDLQDVTSTGQTPRSGPEEPSRMSSDSISKIISSLIAISEIADRSVRQDVIAELPPQVRAVIGDRSSLKQHLLAIVRGCERFEEGKFYFKAALELVLEIETQDVKNAFQIIDNYWPPIGREEVEELPKAPAG